MNALKKILLLNLPERYFHKLSFDYIGAIEKIIILDKKRQVLQKRIVQLSQESGVCFECQGVCCTGDYNHFTIIDYLIRCHSELPVKAYDNILAPPTLPNLVAKKIKSIITKKTGTEILKQRNTKCPELGDGKCGLPPEDRPLRCVLWTCTEFKKKVDHRTLNEIGRLNRELEIVIKEVMKIYKGKKVHDNKFIFQNVNQEKESLQI